MTTVTHSPDSQPVIEDDSTVQGAPVSVHLLNNENVHGAVTSFDDTQRHLLLKPQDGQDRTISYAEIRYLVFLKPLSLRHAVTTADNESAETNPNARQAYRITYHDGKTINGLAFGSVNGHRGLHLFRKQNDRLMEVFIPKDVIADLKVIPLARKPDLEQRHEKLAVRKQTHPEQAPPEDNPRANVNDLHAVTDPEELRGLIKHQVQYTSRPLGQLLIEAGLLNKSQLEHALALLHERTSGRLGDVLAELSYVSSQQVHEVLARQFGLPYVALKEFEIDPAVLTQIPAPLARRYGFMPLLLHDEHLVIAIEDPSDVEAINMLRFVIGRNVEVAVSTREDIEWAISTYYGAQEDEEALEELGEFDSDESTKQENIDAEKLSKEKPIVRLVEYVILEGIKQGASDIHIRPAEDRVDLLYRIDGTLVKVRSFRKPLLAAVVSRIKVVARMNISERRLPQDGQARVVHKGKAIDLRISVIPTVEGESVVIRILDTQVGIRSIKKIGLNDGDAEIFSGLIHKSYGMFLVTGPTGSGKSTTLYAALQEVIKQNINIITVEDPVEYHIDNIEQIQVRSDLGYTFAEALRHILRHDPDAIMIGEIRDRETAKIAVESSLTGHLVLSTLHTNSAASTIVRLLEMGIESYLISSTLLGVMAQRLVRRNCPKCVVEEPVEPAVRHSLGVSDEEVFYRGQGCDHCNGTGYKGRMVVYELLTLNQALRSIIKPGVSADEIQAEAENAGMVVLTQNALAAARDHKISLAEVYRVQLN
jgi:type IV pilus assembly protein PilB